MRQWSWVPLVTAAVIVEFLGSRPVTPAIAAASSSASRPDAGFAQGTPPPSVKGPIKTTIIPVDAPPPATPPAQTAAKPASVPTGAAFRDDFEKPPLGAAWRIAGEHKDGWSIEGGSLLILSQPGKATGTEQEDIKNRFVLDRDLPQAYTVTTRVSVEIVREGTRAGLRVRAKNGGSVMVGILGYAAPFRGWHRAPFIEKLLGTQQGRILFDRTWDEGKPTQVAFSGLAGKQETLWFRIEKKGSSVTGSFSMDGTRFERIGEQFLIGTEGSRLELLAYDNSPGLETGIQFDFVEITP